MATGICYTQSGTEKKYEPQEWWQPSDSVRVAIYESGSTPVSDPIPTAQYTLMFGDLHNDGLAYGDKNPDGSYQCVYIFCRGIGDNVKIYDSFPTPPPGTQYYTYSYTGVRTEYGGNVKWHVGFNVKRSYRLTIKVISTLFNDANKDLNSISLHNPSNFSTIGSAKVSIKNNTTGTENITYDCKNGENTIFSKIYNDKTFLSSTIYLNEFKQNVEYNGGNTDLILTKDFYYHSNDIDITTGKIIKTNLEEDNIVLNLYIEPARIDISVIANIMYTTSTSGGIDYYLISETNKSNFDDTDFDKWKFLGNIVDAKNTNEVKYGQNLGFDITFEYLNLDPVIINNGYPTLPYYNYVRLTTDYDHTNSGFCLWHEDGAQHDYFPYLEKYVQKILPGAGDMNGCTIYSVSMRNRNDDFFLYDIDRQKNVSELFNGQIKFSITWSNNPKPWDPSIKTFKFEGYPEKINYIPTSSKSTVGFAILGSTDIQSVDFHIYGGNIDLKFHEGGLGPDAITRYEAITDQIYDEPNDTIFTGSVTTEHTTLQLSCYIIGDSFDSQILGKVLYIGYRTHAIYEGKEGGEPNYDKPVSGMTLKFGDIKRSEIENAKGKKLIAIGFGTNNY